MNLISTASCPLHPVVLSRTTRSSEDSILVKRERKRTYREESAEGEDRCKTVQPSTRSRRAQCLHFHRHISFPFSCAVSKFETLWELSIVDDEERESATVSREETDMVFSVVRSEQIQVCRSPAPPTSTPWTLLKLLWESLTSSAAGSSFVTRLSPSTVDLCSS